MNNDAEKTGVTEVPFISVRELCIQYTSEGEVIHAVNGISFDLEKGETLALVGETGAGKTSTAKAIIRVLPDVSAKVTKGEIYLGGVNILNLSEEEMRKVRGKQISMVFQDPMTALNPTMRIGKQISEVIRQHNNINKSEAKMKAAQMLEMVGIPAVRYQEYPHQFSGGMRQRVVIAIALACNPQLLLADEPTTALDVTIQAQVLAMMSDLKKKYQTSMLLITHDLGVVSQISDKVAVMYAGQIIEYGSKRNIFKSPSHPYTLGLFGALPNMNEDSERLAPVAGLPPDPTHLPKGCSFHPRCPFAVDVCKKDPIPMREVSNGHFYRCVNLDSINKKEVYNETSHQSGASKKVF